MSDPLLSLVAFHSLFNLAGIILFLPFIGLFARFLNHRFQKDDSIVAKYISQVPAEVPEVAIEAMQKEIDHLIDRVFSLHLTILNLDGTKFKEEKVPKMEMSAAKQYEKIKELEGEVTEFFIEIQNKQLAREDSSALRQCTHSIRHAMQAAKGLKDISHNFREFYKSVNDNLIKLLDFLKSNQLEWYESLYHTFKSDHPHLHFEGLADLKKQSKRNYDAFLEKAYRLVSQDLFSDMEISTLFNVNRELHAANKALILAVKDLLLKQVQAKDFDTLPGSA